MRRYAAIGAALLVAACAGQDATPDRMLGLWGGPDMLVTGTPVGTAMEMPCSSASFAGTFRLDDPSGFIANGTMTFQGLNHSDTPVRAVITASHDTALVTVQTKYHGEWRGSEVFRLVRNQPISYPGGRICAL